MEKVYFSEVVKTYVGAQVRQNAVYVWSPQSFEDCWIEMQGTKFTFTGNKRLGAEVLEKAPEIIRAAFTPWFEEALSRSAQRLTEAQADFDRRQAQLDKIQNFGVLTNPSE